MHAYSWTDIDLIAADLAEAHPDLDPFAVRFDRLRDLVEALADFQAEPGQSVNEQILEAIQVAWQEERDSDRPDAVPPEDEDDSPGYRPNQPYR